MNTTKSRMWENHKYGSVRGIERKSKVEYCDTRQIERDEQRGIQSKPKDGSNTCLLDKLKAECAKLSVKHGAGWNPARPKPNQQAVTECASAAVTKQMKPQERNEQTATQVKGLSPEIQLY